jgi:hypothetical protein
VIPDCPEEEERVILLLREASGATVARINYRASSTHPYPTPYHDVLFGYDWICQHLLQDEFKRPLLARMGVCGELVGGSLASMLALTECRLGESRIGAAALNSPIVDWVFPDELPLVDPEELPEPNAPDETAFPANSDMASSLAVALQAESLEQIPKRKKRTPKPPALTSWQLYGDNAALPTVTLSAERDMLFRQPEHYFDRFASPIHLFRSPHAQLIYPQSDDVLASVQHYEPLDFETQMSLNHYATVDEHAKAIPELPTLARCRAYARGYPPAGTRLVLPVWNIMAALESPLYDQTTEFAKTVRRSIARHTLRTRHGRSRWHDEIEKEQYQEYAQGRVLLETCPGTGLWTLPDNDADGTAQIRSVGAWMKERLKLDST